MKRFMVFKPASLGDTPQASFQLNANSSLQRCLVYLLCVVDKSLSRVSQLLFLMFLLAGCMDIVTSGAIAPDMMQNKRAHVKVEPTRLLQPLLGTYTCESQLYKISIEEKFAARSAHVHMVDDHQVEIEMWVYRPERIAIEKGQPVPTAPPDGYAPESLPTDYERDQYNLVTGEFKLIEQSLMPFRNDFCRGVCEQQVLDKSPDGAWQLLAVTSAWSASYNGLWLVHKDHFERLLAPFNRDEPYRSSEAWWHWQSDSTGLFLTYRAPGERSNFPLFVRLSIPPTYSFLLEGVHFEPSMSFNDAIIIDDNTILLNVNGGIILDDGKQVTHQWFIYEPQTGRLHQAAPKDFETLAKYVFKGKDTNLRLIVWNSKQQQQWLAAHPNQDIWNALGDSAIYTEPYRTHNGMIRIPSVIDTRKPLQIIECEPDAT